MMQGLFFRTPAALLSGLLLLVGVAACDNTAETPTDAGDAGETPTESEIGAMPGEGISVTPAYNVLEELFQTEVINVGLEQLGYTLESPKELEPATMHVDLANGGIDYIAMHWERLHNDFFENSGGDEQLERVGVVVPDVLQGYAIDKATADEYDITSLDQLTDPEIAALFDTDGDGRANMTGCNPGWGCELVIEHHFDAYSLRDTVQHDQGQYFALIADTITRFEQGDPILYYTWTPLWLGNVLTPGEEVAWLEVPYTDLPEAQGEVSEDDTTAQGVNLGFVVDRMRVVANQEFYDNNPAAAQFFELVTIPLDAVSAQNQRMQDGEDTPEDIRRHAEEWIAENQELFDGWIEEARAVESASQ